MNTKVVKRSFAVMLSLVVAFVFFWKPAPMPLNNMKVFVNNKEVKFNKNMGFPLSENNRTLVPIRVISENMGYKVGWNSTLKQVTVQNNDRMVILNINSTTATVNGKQVTMDTKAQIKDNRTYVPLRFVAENMGATVEYKNIGGTQYVYITLQGGPAPELPKDPTDVGTIPGTAGSNTEENYEAIRDFFGDASHSEGTIAFNPIGGSLDNSFIWLEDGKTEGENYEVGINIELWYTPDLAGYPTSADMAKVNPVAKELFKFYLPKGGNNLYKIIDDGFNNRLTNEQIYLNKDIQNIVGSDGRKIVINTTGGDFKVEIGPKK